MKLLLIKRNHQQIKIYYKEGQSDLNSFIRRIKFKRLIGFMINTKVIDRNCARRNNRGIKNRRKQLNRLIMEDRE